MGVVILSDDDLCERVTDIAHEVKERASLRNGSLLI